MIAQGSEIVNTAYFDKLIDRVNSATSTAELQSHVNDAFGSLSAHKSAVLAQIEYLTPYLALLTLPAANPAEIVIWLGKLVTSLVAPQVAAAATYATQLTTLTAKVTDLTSAVQSAEQRLKNKAEQAGNTVPSITIPAI